MKEMFFLLTTCLVPQPLAHEESLMESFSYPMLSPISPKKIFTDLDQNNQEIYEEALEFIERPLYQPDPSHPRSIYPQELTRTSKKVPIFFRWVRTNNAKSPSKGVYILINGGPGRHSTYGSMVKKAKRVLENGYDVVLIDQRGTGHSIPFDNQSRQVNVLNTAHIVSTMQNAFDTMAVAKYLYEKGASRLGFLGHSYGSHILAKIVENFGYQLSQEKPLRLPELGFIFSGGSAPGTSSLGSWLLATSVQNENFDRLRDFVMSPNGFQKIINALEAEPGSDPNLYEYLKQKENIQMDLLARFKSLRDGIESYFIFPNSVAKQRALSLLDYFLSISVRYRVDEELVTTARQFLKKIQAVETIVEKAKEVNQLNLVNKSEQLVQLHQEYLALTDNKNYSTNTVYQLVNSTSLSNGISGLHGLSRFREKLKQLGFDSDNGGRPFLQRGFLYSFLQPNLPWKARHYEEWENLVNQEFEFVPSENIDMNFFSSAARESNRILVFNGEFDLVRVSEYTLGGFIAMGQKFDFSVGELGNNVTLLTTPGGHGGFFDSGYFITVQRKEGEKAKMLPLELALELLDGKANNSIRRIDKANTVSEKDTQKRNRFLQRFYRASGACERAFQAKGQGSL